MSSIANTGSFCDGQASLPAGRRYHCCSPCGNWTLKADDPEEGLQQARVHTGSLDG
jgi:hypothetical protein